MDVSAEIHCGKCGSANYSLPPDMAPTATIACNDCGHEMGNVGALIDELLAQVAAGSAEALRRDLDKLSEASEPPPAA